MPDSGIFNVAVSGSLLATAMFAEKAATLVGLKVTVTVQESAGATVPQVLVCENWLEFVPFTETPETMSGAVPVF